MTRPHGGPVAGDVAARLRGQLADRLARARLRYAQGDLRTALEVVDGILATAEEYAIQGATVRSAWYLRAELLNDLGDTDAAYALADELHRECVRTLPAHHPAVVRAAVLLAGIHHHRGDLDSAERLCRQVLDVEPDDRDSAAARVRPAARAMLLARVHLALIAADRGDTAGAVEELTATLRRMRDRYGARDLDALRIAAHLADLHLAAGDRTRARRLLTHAHHDALARFGPAHPVTTRLDARLTDLEPPIPTTADVPSPSPERPARRTWRGALRRDRREPGPLVPAPRRPRPEPPVTEPAVTERPMTERPVIEPPSVIEPSVIEPSVSGPAIGGPVGSSVAAQPPVVHRDRQREVRLRAETARAARERAERRRTARLRAAAERAERRRARMERAAAERVARVRPASPRRWSIGALAGVAAVALLATAGTAGYALHQSGGGRPGAVAVSGTAATTGTDDVDLAVEDLTIAADGADAVVVSWVDPSGGTAVPVLSLSSTAGVPVAAVTLRAGTTRFRQNHLNPALGYCAVVALYRATTDTVAAGRHACLAPAQPTNRPTVQPGG